MNITLKHHTPLHIAAEAIRECWQSQEKSDTETLFICDKCGSTDIEHNIGDDNVNECRHCFTTKTSLVTICGPNDRALIDRIGNKFKHSSTLEHLTYNFHIDGVSRALLQELARHRIASLSVKSTRYTLKELKNYEAPLGNFSEFLVQTGDDVLDAHNSSVLGQVQEALKNGLSNDIAKYMLPEAYKTSLAWTVNARSLQNFLTLRSNPSALWEIRDLAQALFDALPEDHKYLFEDSMYSEPNPDEVKVTMTKEQHGAWMDYAMQNGLR